MSLFGLFGTKGSSEKKEVKRLPWQKLTSVDQLDSIIEESKVTPVAIFKFSTRCGISSIVMRQFERAYDLDMDQMKLYYLDLLAFRNVSDEVSNNFQVIHQSPQLIVVKDGIAVAHASHHGIRANELHNFV
ncbi:MAG: bacillithiol system redox-active protein YtxJ [Bacteroidetes bacterium]|jgi:bacillithiol system protein YtxJ|nr:MAG: bacillithiol system redox-active protein YtxJ [Bacteroidota bacterium]